MTLPLIALTICVGALAVSVDLMRRVLVSQRTAHAKCIAHIASVTSNKFVADRVRELAEHWDSAEGVVERSTISNTLWEMDGPSVVNLWLHAVADQMDPSSKPFDLNKVAYGVYE